MYVLGGGRLFVVGLGPCCCCWIFICCCCCFHNHHSNHQFCRRSCSFLLSSRNALLLLQLQHMLWQAILNKGGQGRQLALNSQSLIHVPFPSLDIPEKKYYPLKIVCLHTIMSLSFILVHCHKVETSEWFQHFQRNIDIFCFVLT